MTIHSVTPYVGFDGIPFTVEVSVTEGTYPDWEWQPVTPVRHIFGSNSSVVQHMGSEPATITLPLSFDSVADFRAFRRKQGVTSTLTLLANCTSAVGVTRHAVNVDYEDLDQVMLLTVGRATISTDQSYVDVTATFLRCMDPLTGLAVAS